MSSHHYDTNMSYVVFKRECNNIIPQALEIQSYYEPALISLAYLMQSQGNFMEAWNILTPQSGQCKFVQDTVNCSGHC